jgi:hypothetical protein
MALLGHSIKVNPHHLNLRAKACKAFERDILFLRELLKPRILDLEGIIAGKGRVWVPVWGRIVKTDTEFEAGTSVTIQYFCDATKRNWKRRLVLKLEAARPWKSACADFR